MGRLLFRGIEASASIFAESEVESDWKLEWTPRVEGWTLSDILEDSEKCSTNGGDPVYI